MNKKIVKIISCILMIILTVIIISTLSSVYAQDLIVSGKIAPDNTVNEMAGKIFYVAAAICYGAAVIIVVVKGVQFMLAAPEGKAEIKKQAAVYVLGAAFLMLAPTVASIVFNLVGDTSTSAS